MTSRELILAAINGSPHPRVPVAQHNFAFCVRHAGITMDAYRRDPELAAILDALDYCAEAGARFARAQMDGGADLTSIGDSACGQSLISPAHYMKFGRPYQAKYRERMGDGILSLHICGKTNDIIEGMATTGCEVLEEYEYTHHPWQPGSNEFARADPDIVGPSATRPGAGRFRRAPVLRHRRHRLCEATASPRAARAARPGL